MEQTYLIIILLFILAIADLVVGISNDAVNFLNSAIGSQVATRRTILIVASAGIFLGSTFSSGIMEVARKGVFHPEQFFFQEMMIIFLAVMITDILLLDLFNTLGLPTSTTVSIVFELLGAAFTISALKLAQNGGVFSELGKYIDIESASVIVSGIFISVAVAFVIGMTTQYVSRMLLSFNYLPRLKYIGGLWAGFAMTSISYFLVIKGAKGSSFMSAETLDWIDAHAFWLLIGSFVIWSMGLHLLQNVYKINVLRLVVLFGTFSLAMAFAGNDLVNFIGVPIAGLTSFETWLHSGLPPDELLMSALNEDVRTDTFLLLTAGLIMVVTLWFSKKARTVTETEVNLSRQDEGVERFAANYVSRGIVRMSWVFGKILTGLIPRNYRQRIEKNFERNGVDSDNGTADKPAFDLVRASVNLTTASILIALATSQKLPLSTTYVSFMVAMGSSLSDRAWGRDSAVYRVSGVLNVILGWFFTAAIAFTVAAICALFIHSFGLAAIAILSLLIIAVITLSFGYHRKKEQLREKKEQMYRLARINTDVALIEMKKRLSQQVPFIMDCYDHCLEGIIEEKEKALNKSRKSLKELERQHFLFKSNLIKYIARIEEREQETSKLYLNIFNLEQDILQSMELITNNSYDHVRNMHSALKPKQKQRMEDLQKEFKSFCKNLSQLLDKNGHASREEFQKRKKALMEDVNEALSQQVKGIKSKSYNSKTSLLVFALLLETIDLINNLDEVRDLLTKERKDEPVPAL